VTQPIDSRRSSFRSTDRKGRLSRDWMKIRQSSAVPEWGFAVRE